MKQTHGISFKVTKVSTRKMCVEESWAKIHPDFHSRSSTKNLYCIPEEIHIPRTINAAYVGQFFAVMRPVVVFGNCFGLLPLRNLISRSSLARFSWLSWTLWYSVLLEMGILILFSTSFYKQFVFQVEFNKIINLLFYGSALMVYINMTIMATYWKKLVEKWEATEWMLVPEIRRGFDKNALRRRTKKLMAMVFVVTLVEHALEKYAGYYKTNECWGFKRYEAYFRQSYPDFFSVLPFNYVTIVFTQLLHIFCSVSKSYLDLFLICICLILREDFAIVNRSVVGSPTEAMDGNFWHRKWGLYKRVHELLLYVNTKIDFLLLLSYSTNLYFICVQLLACMRQKSSAVEAVYLWLSLIFLIGRVLYLSLAAAEVNDESTRIVPYLRNLPSTVWCSEAERFLDHLTTEQIALTGMNFFTLTRSLILKIVGTIVTYELVLFQFKEVDDEKNSDKNPCT